MKRTCRFLGLIVVLLSLLLTGITTASASTPSGQDAYVQAVLQYTNQYRAANGLPPVVWNPTIAVMSQSWAGTINSRINDGTYNLSTIHRPDGGVTLLPPNADWYGEIIAINSDAKAVVDWWMSSPAHRAALLDPRATDVGIGYMQTTKAGWSGLNVVVENLTGYASTRATLPPVPPVKAGDVAVVDPYGSLYVYPSTHGGDLWQRKFISSGWAGAQQIDVADWNSDGIQDIVTVWGSGKLTVSYGQSNGLLGPNQIIGSSDWNGYDIMVTKWSQNDVYPSVVALDRANGGLFYYRNSSGRALASRAQIGQGWQGLKTVSLDFDGDGRMDVLAKSTDGLLKLYRSNGSGSFILEDRGVIGTGWNIMDHISAITNHLGDNQSGDPGPGSLGGPPLLPGELRWFLAADHHWARRLGPAGARKLTDRGPGQRDRYRAQSAQPEGPVGEQNRVLLTDWAFSMSRTCPTRTRRVPAVRRRPR